MEFDGNDDFVNISTVNMASWSSLTVSTWVNYDSSTSTPHTIVSNWNSGTTLAAVLLRLDPTDDTVDAFVVVEADTQIGGTFTDLVLTPNQWHHVVTTYDTTNGLRAYLDGTLSTTTFASAANLDATASNISLLIGSTPHFASHNLTGTIDEVRIYNRTFSSSEVKQLYLENFRKIDQTTWELYINQTNSSTSSLPNGDYDYLAYAKDTTGNRNVTDHRRVTVSITGDTTTPTTVFGINPPDNANESSTVTFDFKAHDNVDIDTIRLYGNWSAGWGTNYTNSSYVNNTYLNITLDPIPDGKYVWGIFSNDSTGNFNWSTTNRTITIDSIAPVVTYVTPTLANNSNESATSITVNLSIQDTNLVNITYKIFNSTGTYNTTTYLLSDNSTNTTITWNGLLDSVYTYNVTVTDIANNQNTIVDRRITLDTTAPNFTKTQTNTTTAGDTANFSTFYNDFFGLHPHGQWIFSTNNSGSFVNDSTKNFTATGEWANSSKVLASAGTVVGYRWYAWDNTGNNTGNSNHTQVFKLTTTVGDTTPPTFIKNQTNNTIAGLATNFSLFINDDTALNPNGQYIFSINQTGVWVNNSAVNFTTTGEWANVTILLNSTPGYLIGYQWYLTDNAQNTNHTITHHGEAFKLTTDAHAWTNELLLTFDAGWTTEDLIDYPVLIILNSTRINYADTQNSGQDIRFYDGDNLTLLAHEIELWNETGDSFVWVKVPNITIGTTTDNITMRYGDTVIGDGQNVENVWNSDYVGVWHLQNTNSLLDSTSNNNDGTLNGDPQNITHQIDGAIDFDGTGDFVAVGSSASLSLSDDMTYISFVRLDATGATDIIAGQTDSGGLLGEWSIVIGNTANVLDVFWDGAVRASTGASFSDGSPYNIAFVRNGSSGNWDVGIYVNGTLNASTTAIAVNPGTQTNTAIGRGGDLASNEFDGVHSEMQLMSTNVSSDWINATYSNGIDNFIVFPAAANSPVTIQVINASMTGTEVTPITNTVTNVKFFISVNDPDGNGEINTSSVNASFQFHQTGNGEATRVNGSYGCIDKGNIDSNTKNFSCSVGMFYFDAPGFWNITVYAKDTGTGTTVSNISQSFNYISLQSTLISPQTVTFGSPNIGATNQTSNNDPLFINNTGNFNFTTIEINSTDIFGSVDTSQFIPASNFSVSVTSLPNPSAECGLGGGAGNDTQLIAQIFKTVDIANLTRGNYTLPANKNVTGQEGLFFCIQEVPSDITSQTYQTSASSPWTIRLLLVAISPAVRRRKKKKKSRQKNKQKSKKLKKIEDDRLIETIGIIIDELKDKYNLDKAEIMNLLIKEMRKKYKLTRREVMELSEIKKMSIPSSVFSEKIGGLEALTKYMKENLEMTYSEISKELDRDQRTIWTAYQKAKEKQPEPIKTKKTKTMIPLSIFKNKELTVLESIIVYLKEKGMKYSEIAEMLERDQRNIWTIYSRAKKKLKNKNMNGE